MYNYDRSASFRKSIIPPKKQPPTARFPCAFPGPPTMTRSLGDDKAVGRVSVLFLAFPIAPLLFTKRKKKKKNRWRRREKSRDWPGNPLWQERREKRRERAERTGPASRSLSPPRRFISPSFFPFYTVFLDPGMLYRYQGQPTCLPGWPQHFLQRTTIAMPTPKRTLCQRYWEIIALCGGVFFYCVLGSISLSNAEGPDILYRCYRGNKYLHYSNLSFIIAGRRETVIFDFFYDNGLRIVFGFWF